MSHAVTQFWYNEKSEPIEIAEAELLLAEGPGRIVGHTVLTTDEGAQIYILTFFTVLDARAGGLRRTAEKPLLWETEVEGPFYLDLPDDHVYESRAAAEEGHETIVRQARAAIERADRKVVKMEQTQ